MSGGTSVPTGPSYVFVNSAKCRQWPGGPHFYLAAKTIRCTDSICGEGSSGADYGVMEIVEAPNATADDDPAYDAFVADREAALRSVEPDSGGTGTYQSAYGDLIKFQVTPGGARILELNGTARKPFDTQGDVITSDGRGRLTISSPDGSSRVEIDFTDVNNPSRVVVP